MPKDAEQYEPRPHLCPNCSYILGEVYKDNLTRLRLYRHARPQMAGLMDITIPEYQRFVGRKFVSGDIFCDHCGYSDEWSPNEGAMREMLRRRENRNNVALRREVECG